MQRLEAGAAEREVKKPLPGIVLFTSKSNPIQLNSVNHSYLARYFVKLSGFIFPIGHGSVEKLLKKRVKMKVVLNIFISI